MWYVYVGIYSDNNCALALGFGFIFGRNAYFLICSIIIMPADNENNDNG